jgi:hypothetical protein
MVRAVSWTVLALAMVALLPLEATAQKQPACSSLKDEGSCKTRDDCGWVPASIDQKTQKEKRKGYCRGRPKVKK